MDGNGDLIGFIAAGGTPSAIAGVLAWQVSRLRGTVDQMNKSIETLTKRVTGDEGLCERRNSEVHSRIDENSREARQHCQSCVQNLSSKIEAVVARFKPGG